MKARTEPVYVLGSGAIGFPLAAYLADAGRSVLAVRTSGKEAPKGPITVGVRNGTNRISAPVETISLSELTRPDGTIVIATKAHANREIAVELERKAATGPVVILQNGLGVEKPFVEARFPEIYRCVLYVTSQATSEYEFTFRPVTASPIGILYGSESGLERCVGALTTPGFPFRPEANIRKEMWKKAIINSVFNSICPLVDVDNGVFVRDEEAVSLAKELVRECRALAERLDLGLSEDEIVEEILRISKASEGQLISTLQDIRAGRRTEIEFLNLEIARIAASMEPPVHVPRTELLGRMVLAKSLRRVR